MAGVKRNRVRRVANLIVAGAIAAVAIPLYVPAALAFPHYRQIGTTAVYSVDPIDRRLGEEIARADSLTAVSPIAMPVKRSLFLTDGGWRWRWLSIGAGRAFALRRPFSSSLVFNRRDVANDRIFNGMPVAGERSLSGTIAHETTHILVARRFGEVRAQMFPQWKQEGYADYVAHESSLSDADAARLKAAGRHVPALTYYYARRRVAALLKASAGSVDTLFIGHD